jgi:hypothetical protein
MVSVSRGPPAFIDEEGEEEERRRSKTSFTKR